MKTQEKYNWLQKIFVLIFGFLISWIVFAILDFIFQNGLAALFNLATIYPLIGVPLWIGAIAAMCGVVVTLLKKN
ncbi:MAG: hypothetical protein ACRC62_07760 [Microcoleus sp.]